MTTGVFSFLVSNIKSIREYNRTSHELEFELDPLDHFGGLLAISANAAECALFRKKSQRGLTMFSRDNGMKLARDEIAQSLEVGVVFKGRSIVAASMVRSDVKIQQNKNDIVTGSFVEVWRNKGAPVEYEELALWGIAKAQELSPHMSVMTLERKLDKDEKISRMRRLAGEYYAEEIHDAIVGQFGKTFSGEFVRHDMRGMKPSHGSLAVRVVPDNSN